MKLAFSTAPFPQLSVEAIVELAGQLGAEAVELAAWPADLDQAHRVFGAAGIAVACLSPAMSIPPGRRQRRARMGEWEASLRAARVLRCHVLKVDAVAAARGQSPAAAAVEFAQRLAPLADLAAEHEVRLVVENSLAFSSARAMWMLMESLGRGGVSACWDLSLGLSAGQGPPVAVPMLNSHIGYARVRGDESPAALEAFVTRLRGIGYSGYLTLEAPRGELAAGLARLGAMIERGAREKTHQR